MAYHNVSIPDYSELPMSIILHIFRYLGHADRQAAGATCNRWYSVLCSPEMNTNVKVKFSVPTLAAGTDVLRSFNATRRPINVFEFDGISMSDANACVQKISELARFVTFKYINMIAHEFRAIIGKFQLLESLTLIRCSIFFQYSKVPVEDIEYANVLANLKMLSLNASGWQINRIVPSIRSLESFKLIQSRDEVVAWDMSRKRTNIFDLNMLVPHLPHLRELDFSGSKISVSSLLRLNHMAGGPLILHRLRLRSCYPLDATLYTFLKTQTNLMCLGLSNTGINNDCLTTITDCLPLLEDLDISSNKEITNTGAVTLKKLKYLKRLNLSWCRQITADGIKEGIAAEVNTTLRDLDLHYMNLTSEAITTVAKNLKGLRILNLSKNDIAVDDQAVQTIIAYLPKLTTLSLSECSNISDTALTGISKKNSELMKRGIAISANERQGFSIENLRGLQKLFINKCHKIIDISLKYGLKLKELRILDVSYCKITRNGINSLAHNAPAIECLFMNFCYKVSDDGIQSIKTNFKRLKVLNVTYFNADSLTIE